MKSDYTIILAAALSIYASWLFNYTFMGVIFMTGFLVVLQTWYRNIFDEK
jgi:hypothetical protein